MFKSLVVLNCKQGGNHEWSQVFRSLEKKIFCFRPVTCARQIFIFHDLSEEEQGFLNLFVEEISPKTKSCETYTGYDAYEFLLKWVVGLLNSKNHYNDRFVLGKCRQLWTSFCEENAERLKGHDFLKMIPLLFNDAHTIRGIIEQELVYLPEEARIRETMSLCSKHRTIRERDENAGPLKFIYSFWDADEPQTSTNGTKKSIAQLSKKIHRLQEQICQSGNTRTIEPNPEQDNKKGQKLLLLTQLGITSCWAKRQLEKLEVVDEVNHSNIEDQEALVI